MDQTELAYCSLSDLAALLRSRQVSPVEVVRAMIERTERLQPTLGAYITFTPELALEQARRAEREIQAGEYRGPLHGIPVAVKDMIWTRGVRSTFGSRAFATFVPEEDSTAVARLRQAGAILLGQTNLPAFCWASNFRDHAYPIPRNPWNPEYFPGISSPGSAIALSAGLVYGALGNDTGGSIRQPAAYCGITGLKPTYGRVSLYGSFPLSRGLDHIGPMARSALDCALLLDALAGHDPRDPESLDAPPPSTGWAGPLAEQLRPLRIGVPRAYFWEGLQPAVSRVAEAALEVWRGIGWPVREVELPPMTPIARSALTVHDALMGAEYGALLAERPDDLTEELRQEIARVGQIRATDYILARRTCQAFARALAEVFREVDVLVTPTRGSGAPRMAADGSLHEPLGQDNYRGVFNLPGVPAMSIPAGFDDRGLPLGVQLIGPRLSESSVLAAAHAFQSATDWHRRRPPLDQTA
jgi:aspartyl-tRNA(Asn)/glutamyl-tRNA(Gln) amidotransferase subunit A